MQPFSGEALKSGASFILISNDLDAALQNLNSSISNIHLFPKPYKEQVDILVDDVEELFAEAYLTSDTIKTLVLKSIKFNDTVQNRLLKILEEPPSNIRFIILARSQSALLPTIRSRLSSYFFKSHKQDASIRFDFSDLSLKAIFDFLKLCEKLDRDDAKLIIYTLMSDFLEHNKNNIRLSSEHIEKFERASQLLHLNASPKMLIADILLLLLRSKVSR